MFTQESKLTALSIVSVFETSRPLGDYGACVVLNDGAGVSYGICQFTHRSGSLRQVVERYLELGGAVGRTTLEMAIPYLMKRTPLAIRRLATSDQFKKALKAAAVTNEMKDAQQAIAFERYLYPAIDICQKHRFTEPLSLAVIYDSIVHGSFEKIAAKVNEVDEKAWITAYVRERHRWLTSVPRLRVTNCRPKFFLDQIAIGNWGLKLPLNVRGCKLTAETVDRVSEPPVGLGHGESIPDGPAPAGGSGTGTTFDTAAQRLDQVDTVVTTLTDRTDRIKSLWTTVGGSVSQAAWAIFGWLAGVPLEVWIVVAITAALLMLLYLYRQIVLGRIREVAGYGATDEHRRTVGGSQLSVVRHSINDG